VCVYIYIYILKIDRHIAYVRFCQRLNKALLSYYSGMALLVERSQEWRYVIYQLAMTSNDIRLISKIGEMQSRLNGRVSLLMRRVSS
jgi:hypothetical protein